jgi:HSP20 family protein
MAEPTVAMPETPPMTQAVARPDTSQMTKAVEETRQRDHSITPPVDIYETSDSLVVTADLPGIETTGLDIRVDNNVLTLHGQAHHRMQGDPVYQEYALASFFRQFELSERIEQEKITADLKHGVLTLTLPKVAKAKPRAIAVNVA